MLFNRSAPWITAHGVLCAVLLTFFGPSASAAVLFDEPFDYTSGPLGVASAGKWVTASGVLNTLAVSNGLARIDGNFDEDLLATIPGGAFGPTTNVSLWRSFKINVSRMPSGSGEYFAHLTSTTGANRSRVFVSTNNAAFGFFRLGIANGANSSSVIFPTDHSTGTEIVVVVKYDPVALSSVLWVNPASEADASISASDSVSSVSINRVGLRQAPNIGALGVDNLRIGTNFAEVFQSATPSAPVFVSQPSDQTAVEGQSVVFTSTATGAQPISYQWLLNGSPMPGQTTTALVLMGLQTNQSGAYSLLATNVAGAATSEVATLTVTVRPPWDGSLRVLTWNVKGNNTTDWSTNAAQVQAIGRVIQYLGPDVITFNEIPNSYTWQMTNWINAFLPGWFLATNSGTDNFIRSVVASRFQILSSRSHLDDTSLSPYGSGFFTRDLFQARIRVPGYAMPLDVFTTHLKATTSGGQSDFDKRGAEARAVSNFLANVYLPTNGGSAYLLTGDLNEDIFRPASNFISRLPIQNLANPQTGLTLTTPINPVTFQDLTLSIQGSLNVRFDYILPCSVLSSNLSFSQVFRTDVLTNPVVSQVFSNDSRTASDHLPVFAVFSNPNWPIQPLVVNGDFKLLSWETAPGERYKILSADNLQVPMSNWVVEAANFTSTSYVSSVTLVRTQSRGFFTIQRLP